MKDILVIAVNYNTWDETFRFLTSMARQADQGIQVILVDNSDQDAGNSIEDKINAILPGTQYIRPGKNLGYFGAAQRGMDDYLGKNSIPAFTIVTNVDIMIEQEMFFKKLRAMDFPADAGIIAPSIISRKWKTNANPKIVVRYSLKQMKFFLLVCTNFLTQNAYMILSYLKKKFFSGPVDKILTAGEEKSLARIYAPHGAFIIFHENYFLKGGDFRHISFLFGEEIFVAESALKYGLGVYFAPGLRVEDQEHASTGFFYSPGIAALMKRSTEDIIKNYYSQ